MTVQSYVPSQAGDQWHVYDAFLHEQRQWVSACSPRTVKAMLVAAFADKGLLTYVYKQHSHACTRIVCVCLPCLGPRFWALCSVLSAFLQAQIALTWLNDT